MAMKAIQIVNYTSIAMQMDYRYYRITECTLFLSTLRTD